MIPRVSHDTPGLARAGLTGPAADGIPRSPQIVPLRQSGRGGYRISAAVLPAPMRARGVGTALLLRATRPRCVARRRAGRAALLCGTAVLALRPVGRRRGRYHLAKQLPGDVADRHAPLVALTVDVLLDTRTLTLPREAPQTENH